MTDAASSPIASRPHADNASAERAEKALRLLLFALVLWDFGLAIFAIGFPHTVLELGRFEPQTEPMWTRGVGLYWGFAGWMQLLGWRSPRRYLSAVQLSIVFRASAAVIDLAEVLWLLPRPMFYFHYLLLFFVVANLVIAYVIARCLKNMGLPWIEFKKG
jgi:hypothetical protein